MRAEFLQFLNTFVALFVIIDPFAVVPVYLSLTDRFSEESIEKTRHRAVLIALGILLTFAATGLSIFNIFGITLPAFQIAGGILLLLLGLAQLNANRDRVKSEEQSEGMEKEDVSIFPLGTPLLAGPGAISTVVLYATKANSTVKMIALMLAVVSAMAVTHLILRSAHRLFRFLGQTGLNLLTRLMGIVLTAVAVQFILNGLEAALRALHVLPPV